MQDLNELIGKSVSHIKQLNKYFNANSVVVCDRILFCYNKVLNVRFLYNNDGIIKSTDINYDYNFIQNDIHVSVEIINKFIKKI